MIYILIYILDEVSVFLSGQAAFYRSLLFDDHSHFQKLFTLPQIIAKFTDFYFLSLNTLFVQNEVFSIIDL